MTCPSCNRQLTYRQRSGNRCTLCHKEFALEPRSNQLRLHDLRVRRLGEKLSDGGRLRYTTRQLWYAASRKPLAEGPKTPLAGCGCALLIGGVVLFVGLSAMSSDGPSGGIALATGLVVVLAYVLLLAVRRSRKGQGELVMPMTIGMFRGLVVDRWVRVYGQPPPNLVDEQGFTPPRVDRPRVAVVCPDVSVLACLAANGVANTFAAALSTAEVPPRVPVVLLHDASPQGIRFAVRTRAALPGRVVVDAGLHVRAVMARLTMLRLREPFPMKERDLPVTAAERTWLQQGWWSPIAAVKPSQLVAAVTRAIQRAEVIADPERRQAERIGFLSWPAS